MLGELERECRKDNLGGGGRGTPGLVRGVGGREGKRDHDNASSCRSWSLSKLGASACSPRWKKRPRYCEALIKTRFTVGTGLASQNSKLRGKEGEKGSISSFLRCGEVHSPIVHADRTHLRASVVDTRRKRAFDSIYNEENRVCSEDPIPR
jgi:hypothetical protein